MDKNSECKKESDQLIVPLNNINHCDKNGDSISELQPASFEDAIAACGYGKFNIFLLLALIFPCLVQVMETLNLSYVIPIAQCDLGLRLEDKGLLNTSCFIGMIASGFFWGYLCDSLGRKRILVYGYLLQSMFAIISSFSTSVTYLMVSKFFSGLILNGPYSASISHVTEFHSSKYRSRIQLIRGIIQSASTVVLPFLAWGILPRNWNISVGTFDFHSWNIFLLLCAILPFITGIIYSFLPESPKYLMTIGKNREALEVFRKVYAVNTNDNGNNFPVNALQEEYISDKNTKRGTSRALQEGFLQMKPLCHTPYAPLMLLACLNAFSISTSSNTLKLWLPQLFQAVNDYQAHHNSTGSNLCAMLEELTPRNITGNETCSVNLDNKSVYTNSIIVAIVRIFTFLATVYLNSFIRSKHLTIVLSLANGLVSGTLYFAKNSSTVLALSALVSGFGSVVDIILVNITLELFPTTLRTVAVSLHLMATRIGILIGNLLFPYLLYAGCAPPFLYISLIGLCCTIFSFLYPNTDNKPLL